MISGRHLGSVFFLVSFLLHTDYDGLLISKSFIGLFIVKQNICSALQKKQHVNNFAFFKNSKGQRILRKKWLFGVASESYYWLLHEDGYCGLRVHSLHSHNLGKRTYPWAHTNSRILCTSTNNCSPSIWE